MPFPSSFPDPTPQDIDRYKALFRMADPDGGASPNEMSMARKKMEEMEAKFPSIRLHSPALSKGKPTPPPSFDTAAWLKSMLNEVQSRMQEELNKTQTRAEEWAEDVELEPKVSARSGNLTLTVRIRSDLLDAILSGSDHERAIFSGEVGSQVSEMLTVILNDEAHSD